MEYVGKKVMRKEVGGRGACSGAVEAYAPATGLFKVVYEGGDSEEMELAEVSRLVAAAEEGSSVGGDGEAGSVHKFDLNICAEEDGGLDGLDLNEGVNYVLYEGLDPNVEGSSGVKRKLIDLNIEAANEEEEVDERLRDVKRVRWTFDLNVELKEDEVEVEMGKEETITSIRGARASSGRRRRRRALAMPLPQGEGEASGSFAEAAVVPPKVELPCSSCSFNIGGASLLDFLSVYSFLRSFSTRLFLSPFKVEEFAACLVCNDSTVLFDSLHLSLLRALRTYLKSLSDEGSVSAYACLRHLNWDVLDTITWPVFLVEYLLVHSPRCIPGLNLREFKEFQKDYYKMPASSKVAILGHLCDDLIESEPYRSEVSKRAWMEENQAWKTKFFKSNGDGKKAEDEEKIVDDGNGDECYLCKMDGNLICCDNCPAAFHSRCVGVVHTLLPDGDWHCPECAMKDIDAAAAASLKLRGTQMLGTDPHGRHYYTTCNYLLVSDSCVNGEYSFSIYNENDLAAVIVALEKPSSFHYGRIISAIQKHWNLMRNEAMLSNFAQSATAASSSSSSHGANYVNSYAFGGMLSSMSAELTSKSSEDGTRSAHQIMARQLRVITSNKYCMFSWSNIQNLSLKQACGWCFCCQVPQDERVCLFTLMNNSIHPNENFTSEVLGIRSRDGLKNHLVDLICHVMWIENRLHGLLSNPHNSKAWRKHAVEAADVASLKKLLLQLESNVHPRAVSAEWTKHVDSAATKGSASHFVRRSTTRVPAPAVLVSSRSNRKQKTTPTPKAAVGVSLSWWRGGRASRELFNWKVLPRSSASSAGRQGEAGGGKKIAGVRYSDHDHVKRMKFTAWRAAVEASISVDHLALQVRELDANIKWNDIEDINLLPKESKKPAKTFKNVVIRKRRQEGEVAKYLLDFGKSRLIPDIVVGYGSLLQDSSSNKKKYWLAEPHVPLHLLKAFGEKQLSRASKKDSSRDLHESSEEVIITRPKKKGFEYLFRRARSATP